MLGRPPDEDVEVVIFRAGLAGLLWPLLLLFRVSHELVLPTTVMDCLSPVRGSDTAKPLAEADRMRRLDVTANCESTPRSPGDDDDDADGMATVQLSQKFSLPLFPLE